MRGIFRLAVFIWYFVSCFWILSSTHSKIIYSCDMSAYTVHTVDRNHILQNGLIPWITHQIVDISYIEKKCHQSFHIRLVEGTQN